MRDVVDRLNVAATIINSGCFFSTFDLLLFLNWLALSITKIFRNGFLVFCFTPFAKILARFLCNKPDNTIGKLKISVEPEKLL